MNPRWNTLVGAVRFRAANDPGRVAFEFVEESGTVHQMSYGELDEAASGFASVLSDRVEPGDRAIVLCPPGLDYIVALLGCKYAGVWPVPALPPSSPRHLPRIVALMEDARPAAVIAVGEDAPAKWSALAQRIPSPSARAHLILATERATCQTLNSVNPDPKDVALVQYTSGSTGSPRGVVLTHAQLIANLDMIQQSFALTSDDFAVLWLPPYHDMGLIGGILAPLHIGFGVRLMSPASFIRNPLGWLEHMTATGATVGGGPNFAYERCTSRLDRQTHTNLDLRRWEIAFTGAEPVREPTLKRFADAFGPFGFSQSAFYPCYGLAEATLIVSGGERRAGPVFRQVSRAALQRGKIAAPRGAGDDQSLVGCGKPVPGLEVRIVDHQTNTAVGPATVGEVLIHGPSVACGYLRGGSERFGANGAGVDHSYLATGDLGFFDENGELFICGRLSDVVVIRGRNIHPQDIEAAVEKALPLRGISAAFGDERDDEEGLVVVREVGTLKRGEATGILATLRAAVLDAVDVQVTELILTKRGALPVTSSGKIRRREARRLLEEGKLPILASSGMGELSVEGHRTDEPYSGLRQIVAAVLDLPVDAVRTDEPPTYAGLDSYGAMQVADRAEQELGLVIQPAALLGTDRLENIVRGAVPVRSAVIAAPRPDSDCFPLSVGQRAIWHHEALGSGCAYNLPVAVELPRHVQAEAVEQALGDVIARHGALRTAFETFSNGVQQRVLPSHECPLVLTHCTVAADDDQDLDRMLLAEAAHPLNTAVGEVCRASLIQTKNDRQVLLLVVHHLVADAWSLELLVRELVNDYRYRSAGQHSQLTSSTITMRDIVAEETRFLSSPEATELLDGWAHRLEGAPLVVELPRDRPRPHLPSFDSGVVTLNVESSDTIRAFARQERTTPFAVVAAALSSTLSRLTRSDEVVIGSPAARRGPRHRRGVVGLLMNPVPLHVPVDPGASFRQVVRNTHDALTWARKGEEVPFASLVERLGAAGATSVPPIFQTMLTWHRRDSGLTDDWCFRWIPQPGVPLDMVVDIHDNGLALSGYLRYSTSLFDHETAVRTAEILSAVLRAGIANPDRRHSAISMVEGAELHKLTKEWARGPELASRIPGVVERFRKWVAARGESVAVESGNQLLTYRELDERCSTLAHRIVESDAKAIGLLLDHSEELVAGTLGALMAGVPFVPLDPDLPDTRLHSMLEDSCTTVVLASPGLATRRVSPSTRTLTLPVESGEWLANAPEDDPQRLAYVIFTSGSTGRPKGVAVEERSLSALLDAFAETIGLGPGDAMLALTSSSFDISVLELLLPLVVGARVVVAPTGAATDPEKVLQLIAEAGVTHLQATPSILSVLCDAGLNAPGLTILCGGEAAPAGLFDRLRRVSHQVWNVYGPTETTIWSTSALVELDGDPPLGHPLPGESVYLLDHFQAPVPTGVDGEIYIGGVGVSRGYVGRPTLTAARFLPDPFSAVPGSRMYRTGDLARYPGRAHLEFRGRADDQIKVRGYRIEREEVEHVLNQHPAVARSVAAAVGVGAQRQLVAAVQWRLGQSASKESLIEHMRRWLPSYAVPTTFHTVARMPVTSRGKVDINAIAQSATLATSVSGAPLITDTERALAEIWANLLAVNDVSADDNFFALGGHSLLTPGVVAGVRQRLERRIEVADVFMASTLTALAKRIDGAPAITPAVHQHNDSLSSEALLTDTQRRIWTAEQLAPGGTPNVVLGVRIEGSLDVVALERAVNSLLERHAELRVRFPAVRGRPMREVFSELNIRLHAMPPAVQSGESPLDASTRLAAHAARAPFDVTHGPLNRSDLWQLGPDDHVLVVTLHHLVCDATAAAVLIRELTQLYAAFAAGFAAPVLPEPVGHAEVMVKGAQHQPTSEELEWWSERLRGAPRQLLITAHDGSSVGEGELQNTRLDTERVNDLRRCAKKLGATPFVLICAALSMALRRLTGRTDLVIGADIDLRDEPLLADAVVPLVNHVALRIDATAESFAATVEAVRNSLRETIPYARVSYDKVVAALQGAGGPRDLFDVKIAYQPMTETQLTIGTTRLTRLPRPPTELREAVVLFVLDGNDEIILELHHRVAVCDRARAGQILQSMMEILEQGVSPPVPSRSGGFRRRKVRSLDLTTPTLVTDRDPAGKRIVTMRPAVPDVDLAGWIAIHRDEIVEQLANEGALLFRGFGCDTPEVLERVVAASGDAQYDTTEHTREQVGKSVFTPVAYPSREFLLWHNEDSFRHILPARIWFACAQPPGSGGETVVADGGKILDTVNSVAPKLVQEGLMYVRRYGGGLGLDWRVVFATDDRDAVEKQCHSQDISWSWDGDILTTRSVQPGVKRHAHSGEPFWIGQILHFHPAALPDATRSSLAKLYGTDNLPRDCRYADGSPINDAVVTKVVKAYRKIERVCRWQVGDLLLIDNVRTAHGRRPYEGERKLLVMLTAPLKQDA
jgi:amino acid adenylation domain-containing protein